MFMRLRTRLFGFKKADVYSYVAEMDAKASDRIAEKESEIEELKAKLAESEERIKELEANREAVINVLQIADKTAKEMVCEAQDKAEKIRKETEEEVREQKNNVNREIEIKRKAIKNYYAAENKKIDQIKNEVERMRRASMDAIQNFERQLREVERMTENSGAYLDSAKEYAVTESVPESFGDVERNIPVHIVETVSE